MLLRVYRVGSFIEVSTILTCVYTAGDARGEVCAAASVQPEGLLCNHGLCAGDNCGRGRMGTRPLRHHRRERPPHLLHVHMSRQSVVWHSIAWSVALQWLQ